MAIKKKKVSKPAPKKGKPAPKKAAKPAAKPAPRKAGKTVVKPARPVGGKSTPKKAAKPKPASKKPVAKAAPVKKTVAPAPKAVAAKPAAAPPSPPPPVKAKKPGAADPKSLVSIVPTVKPVTKKEPPKPTKVVIPKTSIKTAVKYEPEFTKSVLDNPMQEQTGPTMRYSDADLAEFREIINKKLDAAKKELAYLQGLITRKDEGGDMDEARYMTMEDGSVSMEREQLSQMASRQITFIDHLEKALMRIENKTYGICRVTGKLIDKARLRAVPHATLSIEAKQMMNK
jgi:RNA polymerase-binding transcription factor DksA